MEWSGNVRLAGHTYYLLHLKSGDGPFEPSPLLPLPTGYELPADQKMYQIDICMRCSLRADVTFTEVRISLHAIGEVRRVVDGIERQLAKML